MAGLIGDARRRMKSSAVLVVCVLETRGLTSKDREGAGGTLDPFVVVKFSGQDFKTKVFPRAKGGVGKLLGREFND